MNGLFDERVAANYDSASSDMFKDSVLDPTIDFLAEIAGNGRALEFAVGTGRVALPLSRRGVDVSGIELSRPMIDQMTAKPDGERVEVTIGDMATTHVGGDFSLVYLVYNTISNLLSQDEQVLIRRRRPTTDFASLLDIGRSAHPVRLVPPICLARRIRLDGPYCRARDRRTLGRLEAQPVHC